VIAYFSSFTIFFLGIKKILGDRYMNRKKKDRRFGHHFVDFYDSSLAYGRKKRKRIKCLNLADEIFGHSEEETKNYDAEQTGEDKTQIVDVEDKFREETNLKVREAVERLSPLERQFIEYFYFEDKSYREISVLLNKSIHRLESIHHRALGKLKMLLSNYVKTRFKLNLPEQTDCIICKSPFRQELDKLIQAKKEKETYKSLIRIFKEKYGLKIKTPQIIIGHKKKHMV
jgi:RNA polymerase sigma factor (sigma-70 family)